MIIDPIKLAVVNALAKQRHESQDRNEETRNQHIAEVREKNKIIAEISATAALAETKASVTLSKLRKAEEKLETHAQNFLKLNGSTHALKSFIEIAINNLNMKTFENGSDLWREMIHIVIKNKHPSKVIEYDPSKGFGFHGTKYEKNGRMDYFDRNAFNEMLRRQRKKCPRNPTKPTCDHA